MPAEWCDYSDEKNIYKPVSTHEVVRTRRHAVKHALGVTCNMAPPMDALSAIICAACCAAIRSRGFHVANGNCLLCAARLRMVNHSDSRSGHSIRRQSQRDPAGAIMNRNPKRANDPDLGAAPHLSPTKRLHMHAEGAAPHLSPTMLPLPAARGRRPPSAHSRARVGDEA
jgi:hypothetical protein